MNVLHTTTIVGSVYLKEKYNIIGPYVFGEPAQELYIMTLTRWRARVDMTIFRK